MQKALTDTEDDYEALAKAIGIYNGNTSIFTSKSWPWVLRYLEYDPDSKENVGLVCHSCRYSIKARNKPNVLENNLRRYVWQAAGQPWCFAYGEKEWVSGVKYDDKLSAATGSLDALAVGRINCVTGAAL